MASTHSPTGSAHDPRRASTSPSQDSPLDPLDLDALSLARAMRAGAVDPVEHTERVLTRAAERGSRVGAFASLAPEYSRRQAERADAALRDGASGAGLSPLTGVPFPIKDLVEVASLPFEAGSPALAGNVGARTDGVAEDLIDAGTVTIGKTTTSEFGMSVFSESPAGPPARTPWDVERTAGGSSGGAGAAVASGIVPIAHGNDAGGSIRVPAACNGVVGMVAGRGRISAGPFGADGAGLARHGVLARTVADVAAGMDLLTHQRPGDTYLAPGASRASESRASRASLLWAVEEALVGVRRGDVRPLRIGIITTPMVAEVELHPEALAAVERARAVFTHLGHTVLQAPVPLGPEQWRSFAPVFSVGAASIPLPFGPAGSAEAISGEKAAGIGALTRWLRMRGAHVSGVEYAAAISAIQQLTRRMAEAWEGIDVIVTPTLSGPPVIAAEIPEDPEENFAYQSRFTPFTSVWNMNGWAAMSVPLHRAMIAARSTGASGGTSASAPRELPFGVHLAGTGPNAEATLLSLAAQLEALDPWPTIRW